jgi:hypothetical protein
MNLNMNINFILLSFEFIYLINSFLKVASIENLNADVQ